MLWTIPNILTMGRIVLSAVFFLMLGLFGQLDVQAGRYLMAGGFVLFVIAGLTDIADGYLARKLDQVSTFGRIVDPICDKVLIVGAFAMLAGPDFTFTGAAYCEFPETKLPFWITGNMATAVQPWMVVVILAREFVISGVRGFCEAQGKAFPAIPVGKLKMLIQSLAVGSILFCLGFTPGVVWTSWVKIISIWAAVVITIISGVVYLVKSYQLIRADD